MNPPSSRKGRPVRPLTGMVVAVSLLVSTQTAADADRYLKPLQDSTVRVVAKVGGGYSAATGFVWDAPNRVVTSLHAVPEGSEVTVSCGGASVPASAVSANRDADLVLLETRQPLTGCTPMAQPSAGASAPEPGSTLHTLGYHNGATSRASRSMEKGYADNETLRYLLSDGPRQQIEALRMPSLDLPIYYVQGGLLPGYSGAPVLDEQGRLVGIVDGGLDHGQSSYNWVVPASHLMDLDRTQGKPALPRFQQTSNLFSSGIAERESAAEVEYTDWHGRHFHFVKTKTASLLNIRNSSDDRAGVMRLVRRHQPAFGEKLAQRLRFDIYQEEERGIIVAVPEGTPLAFNSKSGWLEAGRQIFGAISDMRSRVTGKDLKPGEPGFFDAVLDDEQDGRTDPASSIDDPGGTLCVLDPRTLRLIDFGDAGRVLKAGFVTYIQDDARLNSYHYVSFAAHGNEALRASVLLDAQAGDSLIQCTLAGNRGCDGSTRAFDELAQLVAVHLTSFAGLGHAGKRVVETSYHRDTSSDHPDTFHHRYYEDGRLRFYNVRALRWRWFTDDGSRLVHEYKRDADYAYVSFGNEHARIPIRGGTYEVSGDGGATWRPKATLAHKAPSPEPPVPF